MYESLRDIGPGLTTLLAAFVAYLLGLRAYHLQREYELVRRRYLDEGLDAFSADVEHALSVFKNNWQHSLTVLRYYREMDAGMRKEMLDEGYIDLDMSQFRVRPNFRVGELVGDKVFWNVQQLLFAFVGTATSFFKDDLGGAIRHAISGAKLKGKKQDMIDEYVAKCEEYLNQANQYHVLLAEVQNITNELEKQRLSLKDVHVFKENQKVKEAVDRLKKTFADKLELYKAV